MQRSPRMARDRMPVPSERTTIWSPTAICVRASVGKWTITCSEKRPDLPVTTPSVALRLAGHDAWRVLPTQAKTLRPRFLRSSGRGSRRRDGCSPPPSRRRGRRPRRCRRCRPRPAAGKACRRPRAGRARPGGPGKPGWAMTPADGDGNEVGFVEVTVIGQAPMRQIVGDVGGRARWRISMPLGGAGHERQDAGPVAGHDASRRGCRGDGDRRPRDRSARNGGRRGGWR